MRQATLVAGSIVVLCPNHDCGAEQPAPGDGSLLWLTDEVRRHQGRRTCVSCDLEFELAYLSKVGAP